MNRVYLKDSIFNIIFVCPSVICIYDIIIPHKIEDKIMNVFISLWLFRYTHKLILN